MLSLIEACKTRATASQCYLADTLCRLVNGWRQSSINDAHALNSHQRVHILAVKPPTHRFTLSPQIILRCRTAIEKTI